jgi:hypothetical protein
MLHDCSLGHVCAFASIDGHFPFAFSPALKAGGLPKNRLPYEDHQRHAKLQSRNMR